MKKTMRTAVWAAPLLAVMGYAGHASADEHMVLVDTIDVQSAKGLGAFDISFVDPKKNLYVLADRTNASIDFFNAQDDTFIGRVGGFQGVVLNPATGAANNGLSGPDGVTIIGGTQVWAGDGDSTVKVIDIATFKVIDTISTGGANRCDEMAFDANDHILAVANNADTPPFVTLINTDTHQILKKIVFDGSGTTPDATATGIEQPQWSPNTGLFYVSVPQITPSDATQGGISVIDPTMAVTATYPVSNCSPAGLALGPDNQAAIGCSASFGKTPNVLTQSLVIDLKTGEVVANIPEVGGSDEVWYDSASRHYYFGARNNTDNTGKIVPVLGVVDAVSNVYDGSIATSTSAHSVAADKVSHHVFVPIGFAAAGASDPTNPCPDVTKGCIAVYLPSSIDSDDQLAKAIR